MYEAKSMNPVKQVSLLSCDGGGLIMSQLNKSIDNCDKRMLGRVCKRSEWKKQQKYANANMQLHMVALWAQVGDDKPARK